MRRRAPAFTLIELMVVVIIIGILTVMGITQYTKSVEVAKADDAFAFTQSIAAANRMFALDHPQNGYLTGVLSGCATGSSSNCGTETNACGLMWCGYLARQDLSNKPYSFCAGNASGAPPSGCGGSCAAGMIACAMRKPPATSPYSSWGYTVDTYGVVSAFPSGGPPVQ